MGTRKIFVLGPTYAGKTTLVHNFIYTLGKRDVFKCTYLQRLELEISTTGEDEDYHRPKNLSIYHPTGVLPTSDDILWTEYKIRLKISLPGERTISTIDLAITDSPGKILADVAALEGDQARISAFQGKIKKKDAKIVVSSWTTPKVIDPFLDKYHGENVVYCYNQENSSDNIVAITRHRNVKDNIHTLNEIPNHGSGLPGSDLPAFQLAALAPFFRLIDSWYSNMKLIKALEHEQENAAGSGV
jgi:hypothetical protein